jgi:hypothetical protein
LEDGNALPLPGRQALARSMSVIEHLARLADAASEPV